MSGRATLSVPVRRAEAPAPATPPSTQDLVVPPVLRSEDVLQGQTAVAIAHNGAVYRLQTTRQGKLILTK